jgi:hypothetical protein
MRIDTPSRARMSLRLASVVAGAGLALLGCNSPQGESRPGVGSAAADSANRATAAGVGGASSSVRVKGELGEPIEDLVKKPDVFLEFVRGIPWNNGHQRDRACRGITCSLGRRTKLSINASNDGHNVDPKNLPTHGVLMAKMMNHGSLMDEKFSMPAGDEEWYFLWEKDSSHSAQDSSHSAQVRLVKLRFGADGAPSVELDSVRKPVTVCTPEHKPSKAEADFKGCSSHVNREDLTLAAIRADAWMTCSQGCCTSAYPFVPFVPEGKESSSRAPTDRERRVALREPGSTH